MQISRAQPGDGPELIALKQRCPQGRGLITNLVNRPDFFARAKAWPHWEVFTAKRRGQLLGSASLGTCQALLDGSPRSVGYQFEYFVDPGQRRSGVARALLEHLENHQAARGVGLSYLLVQEGNRASLGLFTKAGYSLRPDLRMRVSLPCRPLEMPARGRVRSVAGEQWGQLAGLINRTWQGCQLHRPIDGPGLAAFFRQTPGLSPARFLVLERGGKPAACLGIWDWSSIIELKVLGVSWPMRMQGALLDLLRRFRPLPALPKPGQTLGQWCLTSLGWQDPPDMAALLATVNNLALSKGIDSLLCLEDPAAPQAPAPAGAFRIGFKMHLLVKALSPEARLPDGPVHLDGMHL